MTVIDPDLAPPPLGAGARLLQAGARVGTCIVLLAIIVLVTANVVRDRTLWLGWIMFLPLWPVGVAAVFWDLALLGRSLPVRWLLLCVGLGASLLGFGKMWSPARLPEGDGASTVRVLQWNVQWGGVRGPDSLRPMIKQMREQRADVLLLSEFPPPEYFRWAMNELGESWNVASTEHHRADSYWYRMAVLSRWPVRFVREWPLPAGAAALFEVESPARILRVVMVDLESEPKTPRTPSLRLAAGVLRELHAAGTSADLCAGDFNTPARFLGFDDIARAGYERGAMWSGQWRGTWPAWLPLTPLDIDHIWVRKEIDVTGARIFYSPWSDHRGQTIDFSLK